MSQSPLEEDEAARDYALGWKATWRLVRSGKSWSGLERDCCFLNLGDGTFLDVASAAGFDSPQDGRALATVDWDQDGDLDLWMTHRDGPRVGFLANQRPKDRHWLALRLQSDGKNRHAIGARVEVHPRGTTGRPLVRQVSAGEGYLSQSSTWLHFGLGREPALERVLVRWPGGEREEFTGVQADRHQVLERGTGAARSWERPARPGGAVTPVASALEAAPPVAAARVEPLARVPFAGLPWQGFDGAVHELGPVAEGYQLVTLFTSSCGSCRHELGALARGAKQLAARRIGVLALALDADATLPAARKLLDEVGWTHAAGRAGSAFLDPLAVLLEELLDRPGALTLPTNLLLDREGRLALLYRGPVSLADLIKDVRALTTGGEARFPELPYAGRWIEPPPARRDLLGLAQRLREAGHPRPAEHLLARLSLNGVDSTEATRAERERFFAELYGLGLQRAAEARDREAVDAFHRALQALPEHGVGRLALAGAQRRLGALDDAEASLARARGVLGAEHPAVLLETAFQHAARGSKREAEETFARVTVLEPANGSAHLNLGNLLLERGAREPAIEALRRASELRPDDPRARAQHGKALYLAERHAEALAEYEAALRLAPEHAETSYNLALAAARSGNAPRAREELPRLERLDPDLAQRLQTLLASAPR